MGNKIRLILTGFFLWVCCPVAHAENFAPIVFWNVPNYYSGGWDNIRYSDPESAFTVEWATATGVNNPQCGKPSTWDGQYPWTVSWDFVDAYPVNPPGYPVGSFYNAHYMSRQCDGSGSSGPHEYSSGARRFAGCTGSGPFFYSPVGLNCGIAPGGVDPELSRGDPCVPDCTYGDPINVGVGNKFEQKSEYEGAGPFPLKFSWTYNSSGTPLVATPQELSVGRNRVHNYAMAVRQYSNSTITTAYVSRPDGNVHRFNLQANSWVSQTGINGQLVSQLNVRGDLIGWTYTGNDGVKELYNAKGQPIALINADELQQTLLYDTKGRLIEVRDPAGRKLTFTYNTKGNIESVLLPDGERLQFTYDPANNLATATYPGRGVVQYLYNEAANVVSGTRVGALTGVIDEDWQRYSTTMYDANTFATSTFLGNNIDRYDVTYVKAANGTYAQQSDVLTPSGERRIAVFSPINGVARPSSRTQNCTGCPTGSVSYSYDANGRIDTITDLRGSITDYNYNTRGLLTQKIDAANDATGKKRTLQTDWHTTFSVPIERRTYNASNTLVAKTNWTYNARGQALTQTDPATGATRTTTTAYCEQADIVNVTGTGTCPLLGLVKSIDGPRTDVSDITTYTYFPSDDASCASAPTTCSHRKGDLWKITNALNHVTETLKYDGAGRVLSVKDANGIITDYEYHPRGWLTARKVRNPMSEGEGGSAITRIDYSPTGQVMKVTQPDGAFTAYTYDAAHRLTDIADNAGNTINYTLDNAGNRTKEDTKDAQGALLRTLSRVYNQLGQMQIAKDAYQRPTGYGYDANGNSDTVTDALNRVSDNDYDPLNRLSRTLQDVAGISAETKFAYDALDNLTKITDPKDLDTEYTYNGLGDLIRLSSPDTGITSYTYDSAGNRKTQTDARDITTTYGYDALNRLSTIAYSDGSPGITYTYDGDRGLLGSMYSKGRLSIITDASGTTSYSYDHLGNTISKTQVVNGKTFTVSYAYTLGSRLRKVTYPNGLAVDYVRDAQGRTIEVGVTSPDDGTSQGGIRQVLLREATYYPFGPAAEWTYGNGRLMRRSLNQNYQPGFVEDPFAGGISLGYEFDAVGNLSKLRGASQADPPLRQFGYDGINRLTETKDGSTDALLQGYGYDDTGNRTSVTIGGATTPYTYPTSNHRLTEVGGVTRGYDSVGNTIAIGGTAKEFVYNAAGRMSQAKAGGAVTMNYAYNGKGEQVRKYLGTTGTHTVYDEAGHWLGDYDSASVPIQQAIWLDDLPVGLVVGANNQLHYIEPDHLGTPRVVIDPVRDVAVWRWDLIGEAFGTTAPNQNPDGDANQFVFNMRYPGQRYDAASGLNYNYFRDYEAATGRYVESDPIGLAGGISTYAYVSNTPLVFVDPSGTIQICLPGMRCYGQQDDPNLPGSPTKPKERKPVSCADKTTNLNACIACCAKRTQAEYSKEQGSICGEKCYQRAGITRREDNSCEVRNETYF